MGKEGLAAKLDYLSLISGTHMAEITERDDPESCPLISTAVHCAVGAHKTYIQSQSKYNKKFK